MRGDLADTLRKKLVCIRCQIDGHFKANHLNLKNLVFFEKYIFHIFLQPGVSLKTKMILNSAESLRLHYAEN